jgi:hypothetical protein
MMITMLLAEVITKKQAALKTEIHTDCGKSRRRWKKKRRRGGIEKLTEKVLRHRAQ